MTDKVTNFPASAVKRRPVVFKQADVARALRAAKDAGLEVTSYKIDTGGEITVICTKRDAAPATTDHWAEWRAENEDAA